jgi:hypothetical protein
MYGCRTTTYRQEHLSAGSDLGVELQMRTAAPDADDGAVFGENGEDPSEAPTLSLEGCGQGGGRLRLP